MTENNSEPQNNHLETVRTKVVTIRSNKTGRWEVDFDGVVTMRDIHRIARVLKVEFARAQRRYSMQRRRIAVDSTAIKKEAQLEKPPVVVPSEEITVPAKPKSTLKKVKAKELTQNG